MPSLVQLTSMKRTELQSLCKENNLKANGKTEVLISQLAAFFNLTNQAQLHAPAVAPKIINSGKVAAPQVTAPRSPADNTQALVTSVTSTQEGTVVSASQETSPTTEAAIQAIQATLKSLQDDLATTRAEVTAVSSSLAATDERAASNLATVFKRIDTEIAAIREEHTSNGQDSTIIQLERLREDVETEMEKNEAARQELHGKMGVLQQQVEKLDGHSTTLSTIGSLTTRIATLESIAGGAASQSSEQNATHSRTMVSQSVPTISPVSPPHSSTSTSIPIASLPGSVSSSSCGINNGPAPSRRSSPRKSGAAPNIALPTHMLRAATPSSLRGSSSLAVTAPAAIMPASPLQRARPSLGKHARSYDTDDDSDASFNALATTSPPSGTTPGRRPVSDMPRSAAKDGSVAHARKRFRMSEYEGARSGTSEEPHQSEEDEDDDDDEEASREEGETTIDDSRFADDSLAMQTANEASLSVVEEEYFVSVKSGDDSSASVDPFSLPSISDPDSSFLPSTSDPSFFATASPSFAPRPAANINTTARKSMPMTSLPFPLVSVFAKSPSTAAAPRTSLANFENRRATLLRVPATPQASKTLYGSESMVSEMQDANYENEPVAGSGSEDDELPACGSNKPPARGWGAGLWA
ncbi:hypothetical protein P7C70_g342, partial [Phenoliferia sp. Uapishka_3]